MRSTPEAGFAEQFLPVAGRGEVEKSGVPLNRLLTTFHLSSAAIVARRGPSVSKPNG
jgi:hypothetical protein